MKLFNGSQQERLKEIVLQLQQVRQEKAIRIEEIAAHTRIRPAFLQALEEGRFEDLPELIYVQGFIRHYGDALGLDGAALAKNFAAAFSPSESDEPQENLEEKPNLYIPLVVPYIVLLAGAVFGLFYILNPKHGTDSPSQIRASSSTTHDKTVSTSATSTPPQVISQQSEKKVLPNPVASLPATSTTKNSLTSTQTPPPLSSPTPAISSTPQTGSPVEVTLELQDQSWLRVKADGKTVFMGILSKGERKTWTAQKDLTIRSGNAGAVLVSENNQQPKPLGSIGSVKQVTFTGHEQ